MQKRGFLILFLLLALIGFFIGRETQLTGNQISSVGNLTVNVVSAVACTISNDAQNINFSTNLDAGVAYNATKNYAGQDASTFYNITDDATSTVNANFSIKGADFISGANKVGVGNVSWASNITRGNGSNMIYPGVANLSTNFDTTNRVGAIITPGNTAWYRLWINLPNATKGGTYTSNYTLRCEET